jgi:hypothetical protein
MISFYIFILLIISFINKFIIHVYYFLLANQLASTKKDSTNFFMKGGNITKLPDIPQELSKYINRAIYPERMLRILFRKHYINFPLLLSELDT